MIKENPYILVQEIRKFTFSQADDLAAKLGISPTDKRRVIAGARHILLIGAVRDGHCILPLPYLLRETANRLRLSPFIVYEVLLPELQANDGSLVSIPQPSVNVGDFIEPDDSINYFLSEEETTLFVAKREVYEQEYGIAADLHRIMEDKTTHPFVEILEKQQGDKNAILDDIGEGLSSGQREVLELALTEKVLIVTGGPGVGKTATVTRIMKLFEKYDMPILVCAPTGRAAIRLQELSGLMACTVHRLLECAPGFAFHRNEENPLHCKLLVVDEFSMMDLNLANALFKALPSDILLVIVGDADQLPSVGPGNVLKDIISSGKVNTYHLSEVFRQKGASEIIKAAHIINDGNIPDLSKTIRIRDHELPPIESDFCFIDASNPNQIVNIVNSLISFILPQHGYSSEQIQILTPINKNDLGAKALNINVQQQLNPWNPEIPEITINGIVYRVGDRVMQILNNYDKDIYNGEMGVIFDITQADYTSKRKRPSSQNGKHWNIGIRFDRHVDPCYYREAEMTDQILLAYAVTIHKSQGNEFPVIIIPLHQQHWRMLQRNLIYTAITRGKKLVVVVGERSAFQTAVTTINAHGIARYTNLSDTIKNFETIDPPLKPTSTPPGDEADENKDNIENQDEGNDSKKDKKAKKAKKGKKEKKEKKPIERKDVNKDIEETIELTNFEEKLDDSDEMDSQRMMAKE